MTLLVSLKGVKQPSDIPQAFRQVENWANAYNPQTPVLPAGYTGTFQYVLDPLGWVNFLGTASYAGANIPQGFSALFTLPQPLWPKFIQNMPINLGLALGATGASTLSVSTAGVVSVYVTTASTSFNLWYTGARFHP